MTREGRKPSERSHESLRGRGVERRRSFRGLLRAVAGGALFALTSCATYYDARFEPAPLEVKIESPEAPGVTARALATVRGVRRPDAEHPAAQVELALRLENVGSTALEFVASSVELVTADLQTLGPAIVAGAVPQAPHEPIEPGQARRIDLVVALPVGRRYRDYDFSGLVVRWSLRAGERTVTASAKFQRRSFQSPPYYYGGYWTGPGFWRVYPRVGAFCAY